jgi:hypothetical protein
LSRAKPPKVAKLLFRISIILKSIYEIEKRWHTKRRVKLTHTVPFWMMGGNAMIALFVTDI